MPLDEADAWTLSPGGLYHVVRGGTIIAIRHGLKPAVESGFRVLGAHTDSPNLRIKPTPDVTHKGYLQLGVETYGGLLDYTWLDRDLGLAGGVVFEDAQGALQTRLVRIDRAIVRIPSLAIHLNRDIRTSGLKLNAQTHLQPIWGLEQGDEPRSLRGVLGAALDIAPEAIMRWDLSLMDLLPPGYSGLDDAFLVSPRLDNQAMCHASLYALLTSDASASTQMVCLYDHEEVGSGSSTGAAGNMVEAIMRRVAETEGVGAVQGGLPRAAARSLQISADMAHAVHPNYSDRHEPMHMPHINQGPVIKVNAQQRYATDAESAGMFERLCRASEVPYQTFVNRSDLRCGSTIGPISAARLGIATVDVGNPMLSMHSIREMAGADDPGYMATVMSRFLEAS